MKQMVQLREKKEELLSDNEGLQEEKEQNLLVNKELKREQKLLQQQIDEMADSKEKLESNVRIYDEDSKWQLEEAGIMQRLSPIKKGSQSRQQRN